MFSDDSETSNNPRPADRVADDDDDRPSVPSWSTPYRGFNERQSSSGQGSLPYRPQLGSVRTGSRDVQSKEEGTTGSPLRSRVAELRPSSRRTRRSMSSDADAPNSFAGSGTDSESDAPASALPYRRRASPLNSQELDKSSASMDMSGLDPGYITRSALSDPAFQKDLIQALENLRKLIAAVDQPRSGSMDDAHWAGTSRMSGPCTDESSSTRTITRRSSRMMRRLESQLVQALPVPERLPRDASTSSSSSSSSSRHRARRAHHCRPVLGGTPFVVCNECSEILQLPATMPTGKVVRLQCGGCGEALALTLPAGGSAGRPKKIFSAPQPAVRAVEDVEEHHTLSRRTSRSSEQPRTAGPLHRVLGYSSVSSVLRSRRYSDEQD